MWVGTLGPRQSREHGLECQGRGQGCRELTPWPHRGACRAFGFTPASRPSTQLPRQEPSRSPWAVAGRMEQGRDSFIPGPIHSDSWRGPAIKKRPGCPCR